MAFTIHPDFQSHIGYTLSFRKGSMSASSRKQIINTRISTEAEIVGADITVGPILWTTLFIKN